jgi:hypothetical protein
VGRLNDHDMVASCAEKVKDTLFQQKALRQRCGLPKTSAISAGWSGETSGHGAWHHVVQRLSGIIPTNSGAPLCRYGVMCPLSCWHLCALLRCSEEEGQR